MTDKENKDKLPDTTKHRAKGVSWESVLELKQSGLSHAQIGKLLDCSRQNVDYLVKQYGEGLALVETYKKKNKTCDHPATTGKKEGREKVPREKREEDLRELPRTPQGPEVRRISQSDHGVVSF